MKRALLCLSSLLFVAGCAPPPRPVAPPRAPVAKADPLIVDRKEVFDVDGGGQISFAAWRGRPMLVAMFHRTCANRCPATVDKMREVDAAVHARGRDAQVVLVTSDPHEDTPEKLAMWKALRGIPASWRLLSGSDADTASLEKFLQIPAGHDDEHAENEPDVTIYVFDRDGRRVRTFLGASFDAGEAAAATL